MSHREREGRDGHGRRSHSKPERDPSPKRPRRDGKPTERISSANHDVEVKIPTNEDQKHHRRLEDPLPLEPSAAPKSKIEIDPAKKGEELKTNELVDDTKRSSNPNEVPRSRSYYQHDERGSTGGQGSQRYGRRHTAPDRGRWSDRRERSDGQGDRVGQHDVNKRDERIRDQPEDKSAWRHDGFFELEAGVPRARKRPAFREKKDILEQGNAGAKREERAEYDQHGNDKAKGDRPDDRSGRTVDRSFRRRDTFSGGFASRDRFDNGRGFRGRDSFNVRYGERNQNQNLGFQVEKWKHDLFDEANQSPPPKNEEDQIAKVEALLSL
ncbi:hypothetical protein H6P81_020581 [Aristolochia fimbriata]|uniref:Btz domain-containing protein n=1 Tax=Aristolochia fimbriata TaxID=158543 RepID=A0AAV7DXT6_ARIFI|nr:hypothetical protein H6P81_020581 [Aristolochia fimbriata]